MRGRHRNQPYKMHANAPKGELALLGALSYTGSVQPSFSPESLVRAPIRVVLLTLVLLGLRGAAAEAQHGAQTFVRIRVVDTTGAGLANADVTVLRGLNAVAA